MAGGNDEFYSEALCLASEFYYQRRLLFSKAADRESVNGHHDCFVYARGAGPDDSADHEAAALFP